MKRNRTLFSTFILADGMEVGGLPGSSEGFPSGASGKEPACRFRRHKRHGFDPWVGKIPWSRRW